MPTPRSTTSYALLGLLCVRDWTTYELAQQVRRSLNWFWPRAERKLYDEPKRLVAEGLAAARSESTGRRPRTVYRVTPAGRAALRDWLDEAPAERSTEFEGMIKVFFADAGSRDQLLRTLDRIEEQARARLVAIAGYAAGELLFPQRAHLTALGLTYQFEQERAVLHWAEWAREQVLGWTGSADPGGWDARAVLDGLVRPEPLTTA